MMLQFLDAKYETRHMRRVSKGQIEAIVETPGGNLNLCSGYVDHILNEEL